MRLEYFFKLTLLVSFFLSGCDKEEPFIDDGSILGEWEGYLLTATLDDGSIEFLPRNNCEGNIFEFREDGSALWIDFIQESEFNCLENLNTSQEAKWERLDTEVFRFTLTNPNDGSELIISPNRIVFGEFGELTMTMYFRDLPSNVPAGTEYYGITYTKRPN